MSDETEDLEIAVFELLCSTVENIGDVNAKKLASIVTSRIRKEVRAREINGIRFVLSGEGYTLANGGEVLTGWLRDGEYTGDQVSKALLGQDLDGKEIRGVEMFAVDQQTDKAIGLLI
ncbi:MAG TPA: hypothetical protein VMX15_02905 [Candidatus Heimdallarchaeota archaeon]|nr:hypothetical protein [Candidatus Heimdallarchaeota archaeon]